MLHFIDALLSMMMIMKSCMASNYRYFKVLVQEMSLKVDQGFLNNIIDLFTSSQAIHRDQEVNV